MKNQLISKDKSQFLVSIGRLWSGPNGATEQQDFDISLDFPEDQIKVASSLQGNLLLARTDDAIQVVLRDVELTTEQTCQSCLQDYTVDMLIPSFERSFVSEEPQNEADTPDVFLLNTRDLTIDLYDLLRQEIILHFPLISVCSKSCKGLCPRCGINKNKNSCGCVVDTTDETYKPFQNLKQLIQ